MKKGVKRNRIIITSLAIMIIVAGYLNFTAEKKTTTTSKTTDQKQTEELDIYGDISDEDAQSKEYIDVDVPPEEDMAMLDENSQTAAGETVEGETVQGQESQGESTQDIESVGEAVLTSGVTAESFNAAAKLNREQTRSKNKEMLMEVINNPNVAESLKQDAINSVLQLTDISEKELSAETLLEAKGFKNSVVSLTDASADVVICAETLSDAQRAQIEDIVKRKTNLTADQIVITTLNN